MVPISQYRLALPLAPWPLWSQDSTVQVLATPSQPSALIVRWPGGLATTNSIAPSAKEISVAY